MGMIEDKDIELHIDRETLLQEYIPKAEFEQRLKADMVAILTEIQLEIEKTVKEEELIDRKWANGLHYSEKIIQQKIDKLKERKDGTNEKTSDSMFSNDEVLCNR